MKTIARRFTLLGLFVLAAPAAVALPQGPSIGDGVDPRAKRVASFEEAPANFQLYQRDVSTIGSPLHNLGWAEVRIAGELKGLNPGDLTIRRWADGVQLPDHVVPVGSSFAKAVPFDEIVVLNAGFQDYTVTTFFLANPTAAQMNPSPIVLARGKNVAVGDSFIVMGQSNALSIPLSPGGAVLPAGCMGASLNVPVAPKDTVRTFGFRTVLMDPAAGFVTPAQRNAARTDSRWHPAHDADYNRFGFVGTWPLYLAYQIVANQGVPVAIINGALGSTLIEEQPWIASPDTFYRQHQPDLTNPLNLDTLYGQLLRRVQDAGLASKIRAVFWHQGESERDQADLGLTEYQIGEYKAAFTSLALRWRAEYPGFTDIFAFQVRTHSPDWSAANNGIQLNSMLGVFEDQRTMDDVYVPGADITPIPTAGIPLVLVGNLHFDCSGYAHISRRAYSALEANLPDYSNANSAFNPLSPDSASATIQPTSTTGRVDIFFDVNAPAISFGAGGPGTADAIEDRFDLGPGFTVNSVSLDPLNGFILQIVYTAAQAGDKPSEVTYLIDREAGTWIRGANDMDAFGFTIPVN